MRRTSDPACGFTLVELVVTLAVIGLAAALVAPRVGALGGWRVEAAAGRLADALTLAREAAVLGGRPVRVEIDRARGAWSAGAVRGVLPPGLRIAGIAADGTTTAGATVAFALDPAGDAAPVRVDVVDARGHGAAVVLAPAAVYARVVGGGGS
jgi:general secretion pathway protein H